MIRNGFRVFRHPRGGGVRIARIADGHAWPLAPNPGDEDLADGYYDEDWNEIVPARPDAPRPRAPRPGAS